MSNPDLELVIIGSDAEKVDTIYGADGTEYLKSAGDSEGVPTDGVDPRAPQLVQQAKSATGTVSTVAGSASSVTLLAANTARKGATITNDSSALLYVKLAASAASTSAYTVVLSGAASAPFAYYECPFSYRGDIRGIWASATGNARITELV